MKKRKFFHTSFFSCHHDHFIFEMKMLILLYAVSSDKLSAIPSPEVSDNEALPQ